MGVGVCVGVTGVWKEIGSCWWTGVHERKMRRVGVAGDGWLLCVCVCLCLSVPAFVCTSVCLSRDTNITISRVLGHKDYNDLYFTSLGLS